MEGDFVELSLTCTNQSEADKIANRLLELKLIACVRFMEVESRYWWDGEVTSDHETLLSMESVVGKFAEIEAEVAKLHSYDTFVLKALPVKCISARARQWLNESIAD